MASKLSLEATGKGSNSWKKVLLQCITELPSLPFQNMKWHWLLLYNDINTEKILLHIAAVNLPKRSHKDTQLEKTFLESFLASVILRSQNQLGSVNVITKTLMETEMVS